MKSLRAYARRHRLRTLASLASIALAVSCGLAPGPDLPSAVDDLGLDGLDSGMDLDIGAGAGGSSAGSGGSGPCSLQAAQYECRGAELWQTWTAQPCLERAELLEVCGTACLAILGTAMCAFEGAGGEGGMGGQGGSAGAGSDLGEGP